MSILQSYVESAASSSAWADLAPELNKARVNSPPNRSYQIFAASLSKDIRSADFRADVTAWPHGPSIDRSLASSRVRDAMAASSPSSQLNAAASTYSYTGTRGLDLRFPGQMFQAESGLHYNWFREYDPTIGRFTQPDPLGLAGIPLEPRDLPFRQTVGPAPSADLASLISSSDPLRVSRYAYANNNPVQLVDPTGQAPNHKTFGLPPDFWKWYHRQIKRPGDPDLTKDEAIEECKNWISLGRPGPETPGTLN